MNNVSLQHTRSLIKYFLCVSDTERSPEKRSNTNLRKSDDKQSDYVGSSTGRSNCDSMVGHGRTVSTCKTYSYLNHILLISQNICASDKSLCMHRVKKLKNNSYPKHSNYSLIGKLVQNALDSENMAYFLF